MNINCITRSFCLGLLITASFSTSAQTVDAPNIVDGDNWGYNVTEEKAVPGGGMVATTRKWENAVTRAGAKTFSISVKQIDSTGLPREVMRNSDWSTVKSVNGKSVVTSRPYDFPLKPGKEWQIEYSTEASEPGVKVEKVTKHYTAIGWMDIKVPAGSFHALKVEMEGEWSKEFNEVGPSASTALAKDESKSVAIATTTQARTPKPATGKLYAAFWYVPEIKSHVKSIGEDYSSGGALHNRTTEVLESVHIH